MEKTKFSKFPNIRY